MAQCIREIYPMSELYIARLDDAPKHESTGSQIFIIASCALKWALAKEVDIISISWTYKRNSNASDSEEAEFAELIRDIVTNRKKPILFCSLPDSWQTVQVHDFAQAGLDGVIRICAAGESGENTESTPPPLWHSLPTKLLRDSICLRTRGTLSISVQG
ncbi:hypothetical protein QBC38DRAFT_449629 [Podospora fimiseda]|uniref:Peptidase S8/S53 domain-containing protein n=1 Tax=Podospora fimiseda TaxID=252190 RepID=A0AAN7BEF1_9PEZI|nr:hypothetical protein QBC38DRAFT_449629 [Podospora fimiseda]